MRRLNRGRKLKHPKMINDQRASRAFEALKLFDQLVSGGQDWQCGISDLVCDLRHLADVLKLDWEYIDWSATNNYLYESVNEKDVSIAKFNSIWGLSPRWRLNIASNKPAIERKK